MSAGPKFPDVTCRLVGTDGNAFSVIGRVVRAMERAGVSAEEIRHFREEATAGDYDHLLQTVMKYAEIE
jgi:hypothetical protein